MVIIAAMVAFVILVVIMIQQRHQISIGIAKEHSDTAPATWTGGDDSIANVLAPATAPIASSSHSN
ncbi:MAG: hypothetical protein ABSC24_06190 [Verrucomicrobiota bacterium]|jgi:preprotein translocase subunit SecG